MKIEKINDNQIRCTLTHADLVERQLHLSELAYGTEKAKSLFQDMMQQAAYEFGFEANDIPLMIEAIPASADSIVLIITKVEDPDELDARFSKFAPSPVLEGDSKTAENYDKLEGAETFLDLLEKVKEKMDSSTKEQKTSSSKESPKEKNPTPEEPAIRLFSFSNMEHVLRAVRLLNKLYTGSNTLYKDVAEDVYILALTKSEHSTKEFNRICNMLTEYGSLEKASPVMLAFLEEHCEVLIASNAVEQLSLLNHE